MAQWAASFHQLSRITKGHQDKLDAVLCALIGHHWRFAPRAASMMLGDLQHGYMIAPVTPSMRSRLETAAAKRGLPIDGVVPRPLATSYGNNDPAERSPGLGALPSRLPNSLIDIIED
jgi:hypothetical protein